MHGLMQMLGCVIFLFSTAVLPNDKTVILTLETTAHLALILATWSRGDLRVMLNLIQTQL
jgi:hypothetical protein